MYEILKQYEKIGERVITLDDLKYMLGISNDKYLRYQSFRCDVLEPCQKALEQYTDIKYTFKPITVAIVKKQINDYIFAPNKPKEEEKPQERKNNYNVENFKGLVHTTERWIGEESSKEDDFNEIINSVVIPFD